MYVYVLQNFVALIVILIQWCIPDMPMKLKEEIQREKYITNEIIIAQETSRVETCLKKTETH